MHVIKKGLLFFSYLLLTLTYCYGQEIEFTPQELEWIENHPEVRFGYDPTWEPYEIYEEGKYSGIVSVYIQKIEQATGIKMIPVPNYSWEESIKALREGTLHMVPDCAVSDDRKEFLAFTEPYITEPIIISTRRDFHFVGSFEDLYGMRVAIPREYWTNQLVRERHEQINIIEYSSIDECLEALSFEEVDAVVGSLGVISFYINNKGFTNLKVSAPANYEAYKLSMAFTKDWEVFRDICQKVLNSISPQERSRIRKDWISVRYEYAFNWTKAFNWLLFVLGIIFLGYLLFYLWNRSLKKQIKIRAKTQVALENSLDEVKKSNQEKKVLLQEIHHRVKNNLQIITSLIRLQAQSTNNEEVEQSLNNTTERIRAIALIHEKIYNTSNLNYISAEEYIKTLVEDIVQSFSNGNTVNVDIDSQTKALDLQAIVPIALILNELITNSLKYAFRDKKEGLINIQLIEKEEQLILNYSDNGEWLKNLKSKNFGTSLVSIFTDQLEGEYKVDKNQNGTSYHFVFQAYE